ncbi:MAG: hypothetical protein ACOCPS_06600 [Desulfonatronovibrio sp.]
MLTYWLPWKFLVKRAAKVYGIIDPLSFMARFRQFAQPSEVQEPIELLRAGIIFHARGLINKAIQHNLDWVWPYWVERQFNPVDISFVPRAFSFSHINLTHRNWTAVGHPDLPLYPLVDPRGLVTPLYDGWSLDLWLMTARDDLLLPSRNSQTTQEWILSPNLAVKTITTREEARLESLVSMDISNSDPVLNINVSGHCPEGGYLIAVLRPYNPEGIQFIDNVQHSTDKPGWLVNSESLVEFSQPPEKVYFSNYHEGDVLHDLNKPVSRQEVYCKVGMATSAALFPFSRGTDQSVQVRVPLKKDLPRKSIFSSRTTPETINKAWDEALSSTARLRVPDDKIQFLYDAAIRTLILLSADSVVPGPYTYRRFWFRDACLMLNGMMAVGMTDRAFRLLDTFPHLQKLSGYFQSQKGEWDSNGQVLWIMDRFQQLTNHSFSPAWMKAVRKGARWITRKRISKEAESPYAGLLPAGFSAEHLGPNDYYYWDDFWGLAGLRSAARLAGLFGSSEEQVEYDSQAHDFEQSIYKSIGTIPEHRSKGGIPASPYRRMDAGAIGSMVADYPLQLTSPHDRQIMKTTEYLLNNCFHKGAFFQDMIHSGLNAYLTLDIAQTLLRAGDSRYKNLIRSVADMASPTGQWPEAVHPLTGGGCMGDGQHGWAAAEWAMMIRNLFIREEGNTLILGSGLLPEWTAKESIVSFGPSKTPFGSIEVSFQKTDRAYFEVKTDLSNAHSSPDNIIIDVPGYRKITLQKLDQQRFELEKIVE